MQDIESVYPLTPMQEGMLFHTLHAPESAEYFKQLSITLEGDLDAAALAEAWRAVTRHYAVLRTAFVWDDVKQPVQAVLRTVEVNWSDLDWREVPGEMWDDRHNQLLRVDRSQGFDLQKPPLSRFTLIRRSERLWQFIWSFHHIVLDGWSVPILLRSVLQAYQALRSGKQPALVPVPAFRDYVVWLKRRDPAEAEIYWRRYFSGVTPQRPLRLRGDKTGSNGGDTSPDYGELRVRFADQLSVRLQAVAKERRITPGSILQGVWAYLLHRCTGSRDVVFGAVVSGRTAELPSVESMVGMFVNTVPVRIRIEPSDPFVSLWRRMQTRQFESSDFEDTPLLKTCEYSGLPRSKNFFDTLFVFENYPAANAAAPWGDLRVRAAESFERSTFPLTVTFTPGTPMSLLLSYESSRFSPESIAALAVDIEAILTGALEQPERPVAAFEKTELAAAIPDNGLGRQTRGAVTDYPRHSTIGALFEEQAVLHADRTALIFGTDRVTYRDLNRQANRIAHLLLDRGCQAGTPVGICSARCPEMIAAILGILKAGCIYVPLDPAYPSERLWFLVRDTQCDLVLADASGREAFAAETTAPAVIDIHTAERSGCNDADPHVQSGPESLAYVMYTSGSTGQPKGVAVPNRAVVRLVRGADYMTFGEDEVFLQLATLAFDASTFEIWGALLNGATLVLPRPGTLSLAEIGQLLRQHRVTTLFLTTGLFHLMADQHMEDLKGLRNLLAGGDVLSPVRVRRTVESCGNLRFAAVYGPTENTTFSTACQIRSWNPTWTSVPLGRPIANGFVQILDEQLQPANSASREASGELYLGGDGLAAGYWNRPELTAERFIASPVSGERLYRTGDLVRWLDDGNLEFMGRIDTQVKIRGFRVETAETEHILEEHEAVDQAAVVAQKIDEARDDKRLAAFVVLRHGASLQSVDLRNYLAGRLPDFMIPTAFSFLPQLPLTPAGKVDRRKLATEPVSDGISEVALNGQPRTETERTLCRIWADVLARREIGIDDNFFDLGGDSILSIRIVSRAAQAGVPITLKQIFQYQTVGELAPRADAASGPSPGEAVMATSTPVAAGISNKDLSSLLSRVR